MGFLQLKKEKDAKRPSPKNSGKGASGPDLSLLFRPGRQVDVIFYLDPTAPQLRRAVIHECDHGAGTMVISQTSPPTLPSTRPDKMALTGLVVTRSGDRKRVGNYCRITSFVKAYALNERVSENAFALKYSKTIQNFNIRTAYRFEPSAGCEVIGRIIFKGHVFKSHDDFNVSNISVGGAGLMVKDLDRRGGKSLLEAKIQEGLKTEFRLVSFDSMKYERIVTAATDVIWKDRAYSENYGFIGARFSKIGQKEEKYLQQFVHQGQLYHIRRNQGLKE